MKYSLAGCFYKWALLVLFTGFLIDLPSIGQENNTRAYRMAILPFRNSTNLSGVNQFADSLKSILQKGFSFSIIEDEELNSVLKKRSLNKKNPMDDEFAFAAGKFVKADYLINGELKFINETFDFLIQLRDINQQKIIQTFHLANSNKQILFKELLKLIPEDLTKDFTASVQPVVNLNKKDSAAKQEQKAENIQISGNEKTEVKITPDAKPAATSKNSACDEQLYNTIMNYLKQVDFSIAFTETIKVLNSGKNDSCIIQTLDKAYSDGALLYMNLKNTYSAYSILDNGVKLIGTRNLKTALAKIYRLSANEELYNICIKDYPSEFASSVSYAKKNDILSLKNADTSRLNGWYRINIEPGISDSSSVGYIKAACVLTTTTNKLVVVNKDKTDNVLRLFSKAVELNPALKWQIMIDEKRHLAIGITAIFIVILLLLLRVKPKPAIPPVKQVKKSKWQQRLEEAAKQRGISPPR